MSRVLERNCVKSKTKFLKEDERDEKDTDII